MKTRLLADADPVDQLVDFRSAQATQTELVIAGLVGSSRHTGPLRAQNSYYEIKILASRSRMTAIRRVEHRELIPLSLRFSLWGWTSRLVRRDIVIG